MSSISSKKKNWFFIDDYAHHPEELRALINGAKGLFEKSRCTILFQPHLYSRTRDFADGFAEVLDLADEVVLLPIYPAREEPIEGVNSNMILDRMNKAEKKILLKEEIPVWINKEYLGKKSKERRLLITAGAGDIDTLVPTIKEICEKNL